MEDTGTSSTHWTTMYSRVQSIMMNRVAGGMDANVSAARPDAMLCGTAAGFESRHPLPVPGCPSTK